MSEHFCGLVVSWCKSCVAAAANIHEMLKLRAALQAVARTVNSGISLRNKGHSDNQRHASLSHWERELQFLPPARAHKLGEEGKKALRTYMANNLQLRIDEVVLDDYLLASIKQWERILLEDITIGSTCSRQSKHAVAQENYFIRIWHQNQSGNRQYTYSDIYGEVHYDLEVTPSPNSLPLLLAYIQQYKVLVSSSLIE